MRMIFLIAIPIKLFDSQWLEQVFFGEFVGMNSIALFDQSRSQYYGTTVILKMRSWVVNHWTVKNKFSPAGRLAVQFKVRRVFAALMVVRTGAHCKQIIESHFLALGIQPVNPFKLGKVSKPQSYCRQRSTTGSSPKR